MVNPDWLVAGPPSTEHSAKSYRGNSGPRSVPNTSQITPSSNAAMSSSVIAATVVSMPPSMADNHGSMAILPLSGPTWATDTYFMALVFFLVLIVALAVAGAARWGSHTRTYAHWRVAPDGDSPPLPQQ